MRAKRDVGEERGLAKTRNFKKSQMIQTCASKYYKQYMWYFQVWTLHCISCMQMGGRAERCWEMQREPGVQGEVSG